jgi:alkylated DNA repair dioxygenase AlkB
MIFRHLVFLASIPDWAMQFDLFDHSQKGLKEILLNDDGIIEIHHGFFHNHQQIFLQLCQELIWSQDKIRLFGKLIPIPRLQSWYGDSGIEYSYSKLKMQAKPWTPTLTEIKKQIELSVDEQFNSVLCNWYRTGKDYVAFHADDEPELGHWPTIASASFGITRVLSLKHRYIRDKSLKIEMPGGSLLVFKGAIQEMWQHSVLKRPSICDGRINLTFRKILSP